jgi:hypothetical protein
MALARVRQPTFVFGLVCTLLFAGVFLTPRFVSDADPADIVTRQSARVAVLFWALAAGFLLLRWRQLARPAWTWGCVAFLAHVAIAFDRVHGWSHAAAVRHVEEVSGFGPGVFVSYAFTLLWVVDATWWEFAPRSYDRRPTGLDWGIHGCMAFVVFNGTVVYETGFIRRAGIVIFAGLAGLVAWRLSRRKR